MTHAEIIQKVKDTFKVGDKVYLEKKPCNIWEIKDDKVVVCIEKGNFRDLEPSAALKYLSFAPYTLEPVGVTQERPKPKKRNGDPFEVGDEVWALLLQGIIFGKVIRVTEGSKCPVCVEFPSINGYKAFTSDGGNYPEYITTLFHQKPVITFED